MRACLLSMRLFHGEALQSEKCFVGLARILNVAAMKIYSCFLCLLEDWWTRGKILSRHQFSIRSVTGFDLDKRRRETSLLN